MRISDWSSTCALPISIPGGASKGIERASPQGGRRRYVYVGHVAELRRRETRIGRHRTKRRDSVAGVGMGGEQTVHAVPDGRMHDIEMGGRRVALHHRIGDRSEEHTSELNSLMRISYAVF